MNNKNTTWDRLRPPDLRAEIDEVRRSQPPLFAGGSFQELERRAGIPPRRRRRVEWRLLVLATAAGLAVGAWTALVLRALGLVAR